MPESIRRSILYSPADKENVVEEGVETDADVLQFDLEDTVSVGDKEKARENVQTVVSENDCSNQQVFVRINEIGSDWWLDDATAVMDVGVDGIRLPKIEEAWQIETAAEILNNVEIGITLETPKAMLNGQSIATAAAKHDSITHIAYGNADYTQNIGAPAQTDELRDMLRFLTLSYASIGNLDPIESVYLEYSDSEGLREVATRAREFGFTGMSATHPGQIKTINEVFTPDEEEYTTCKHLVKEYDASATNSMVVDDVFLDEATIDRYRKIIERYEIINELEG